MFLSLFLGFVGGQHFYLGRPVAGIVSILFAWTYIPMIIGFFQAYHFYHSSDEAFDAVHNKEYVTKASKYMQHRSGSPRINPRHSPVTTAPSMATDKAESMGARAGFDWNISRYRTEGVKHFRNSEIKEAMQCFRKALHFHYEDAVSHFNMAACYSILEQERKAYFHLSKAVEFGFKDTERIEQHPALAYLRGQESFESFRRDGYLLPGHRSANSPDLLEEIARERSKVLLERIRALGSLRDEGLLTEEEFEEQKRIWASAPQKEKE